MTLSPHRLLVILLAAAWSVSAGCSNSCDELVAVGCEYAGEQSDSCTRLRERADRVSADDKRACAVALSLVETLEKAR